MAKVHGARRVMFEASIMEGSEAKSLRPRRSARVALKEVSALRRDVMQGTMLLLQVVEKMGMSADHSRGQQTRTTEEGKTRKCPSPRFDQ
jgi:hypothetical protein